MSKIVTYCLFFGYLANLKQLGAQISDTEFSKVIFAVRAIFFLTKTKNRTKKYLTQLSHYCFE